MLNSCESSFKNAEDAIRVVIGNLYKSVEESLVDFLPENEKTLFNEFVTRKTSIADLKNALAYLCQYFKRKTGKKVFLLIDEYDTPITAAYVNNYYDDMIDLMRGLLGEALKDNVYLNKGIMTGITRVSQDSIFSGLNNLDVYSLLREQSGQYFGFTGSEVKQLLDDDGHSEQFEAIKSWYNGYQIGKHILYNPWSIINCVKQGYKYRPYWLNTSDDNSRLRRRVLAIRQDPRNTSFNWP